MWCNKAGRATVRSSTFLHIEMATTVLGQQPRYMQLAQTLLNEIQGGQFPIGTLLPTEFELCEQFGASRFTVRQAIKQLEQRGLVDRRPGIGTRVKAIQTETAYRQVMERLSDLHRYTSDTELEIESTQTVEIDDAELLERLSAKPGETWLLAEGIRRCGATVTRACVVNELNKLKNFSTGGLTGPLSFDNPKAQAVLPIKLFQTDPKNASVKSVTDFIAY